MYTASTEHMPQRRIPIPCAVVFLCLAFFFGKTLWDESRPATFQKITVARVITGMRYYKVFTLNKHYILYDVDALGRLKEGHTYGMQVRKAGWLDDADIIYHVGPEIKE